MSPEPSTVAVEVEAYGPFQCKETWDVGHPVLATPCFATGPGIRVRGRLQAMPGVQADVTVYLEDAASGERSSPSYTCRGLMFTDFAPEHDCGPFELSPTHGHSYRVVQSWRYTGREMLPGGTAKSASFAW